jgi:two-component system sensor histidine kinase HydH
MDTFILAATSFIIPASLVITRKRDKLQESFAGLCIAVFVVQAAVFLRNLFAFEFLLKAEYLGLLAIAPVALYFFRLLTRKKSFLSGGAVAVFIIVSLGGAFFLFTPLSKMTYFRSVILLYMICALTMCYFALMWHVKRMPPGTEKKRLGYLLFACPIALILSNIDLLNYWGLKLPVMNGIVLSILLYLILLIIAYPQLNELHDFLVRALVIFVSTVASAIIFYFVALFFSSNIPSFAGVLMASFLIVISLTPIKIVMKNVFSYFYPENKDVFTSLYEFDEKLEREKALMLAEMAPVFAHEIRNPLGSIKGAAQYLKSEAFTEEQKELLNVIVDGTDRLNNVVSQFLDYARPYNLDLKSQNINVIIKKTISIIATNKQAEKIVITQELDENLPEVKVDEQQFIQVVLNIALNAIESMPQGGTLTFRTSKSENSSGERISLMIRDTGCGIDEKEINDIFKPFFTTKERGVGLGLAICQKIIKEHGGHIRVKSIPGQGTIFLIRLKTAD